MTGALLSRSWTLTPSVAYDIGVHVGDGNMYSYRRTHRITYCGHLLNEKDYYKFLEAFVKRVYKIHPIYLERPKDNTVLLMINSRELLMFKHRVLKLPIGSKDKVGIPPLILEDNILLRHFMRGLGDTDFSLSFKKNRKGIHCEPRLEIYIKSQRLALNVKNALQHFDFTSSLEERNDTKYHGYMIRMYGKRNLQHWLDCFGFSNSWIHLKIKVWKTLGYLPIRKTYDELIWLLKSVK